MSGEKQNVIVMGNRLGVLTVPQAFELVAALSAKQQRLLENHWPAPRPHEVEPWQNKRRTPWRKRK